MKEITEKTETFRETIIGDVFSKIKFFAKIVACIYPLTIFAKHFILFVSQGYEYALIKLNRTAISANLFLNHILSSHYYLAVRH